MFLLDGIPIPKKYRDTRDAKAVSGIFYAWLALTSESGRQHVSGVIVNLYKNVLKAEPCLMRAMLPRSGRSW